MALVDSTQCTGKERFERHMELVHNQSEVPLTESEIEQMSNSESEDIRHGPETPRRNQIQTETQEIELKLNGLSI